MQLLKLSPTRLRSHVFVGLELGKCRCRLRRKTRSPSSMTSMLMYQRGVLPYLPPLTNVSFGLGQSELMSQGVRHSVRKNSYH